MIDTTLKLIDVWYNEPASTGDRGKLLSKLALLELSGWIEAEIDQLFANTAMRCGLENSLVKEIIDNTHGFNYSQHLKSMFCRIYGDLVNNNIEAKFTSKYPGELEYFKSLLGSIYKKRNSFAHTHLKQNILIQITYDAPSWSMNQYRLLKKHFQHFSECIDEALLDIGA